MLRLVFFFSLSAECPLAGSSNFLFWPFVLMLTTVDFPPPDTCCSARLQSGCASSMAYLDRRELRQEEHSSHERQHYFFRSRELRNSFCLSLTAFMASLPASSSSSTIAAVTLFGSWERSASSM